MKRLGAVVTLDKDVATDLPSYCRLACLWPYVAYRAFKVDKINRIGVTIERGQIRKNVRRFIFYLRHRIRTALSPLLTSARTKSANRRRACR